MLTAVELLKQGRTDEIWTKYCGFLDLTLAEFMEIQSRLLMEQIDLLQKSDVGKRFMGAEAPKDVVEFRRRVPITTYEDYAPILEDRLHSALPAEPYLWAHTSGRSGSLKWVPYTREAYVRLGERVLAGVILSAARSRGDVRLEENDVLVYNTPPRPYISGVALRAVADHFSFRFIPPLDETEDLSFQERIEKGFETALVTGIDILGSLSVVLVKMGERFAQGARTTRLSTQMLHPSAMVRLLGGVIRSKLEKRSMLPKDLWKVKAIPSGGMDTSIYKEKIAEYWGVVPYEQYGSTEEGAIATQTWNKEGMTFFPDAAFLEFVPEEEWNRWREEPGYIPPTRLLSEVEPNKRYEVILTNFYGKPLLRYRMHDVVKFSALEDKETGVKLPQMVFVGRTGDLIDLAGFTGLIDEKMVWQAIVNTGISYEEWAMRKERGNGASILHLYIELKEPVDVDTVHHKVHESLKALNPFYADYESLIEIQPLRVTLLAPGSYRAYMMEKQATGADLAHLKPPHMNVSEEDLELLLQIGKGDG
jgi:phenylacetate-coenzyme A ligase PaaK-like adenylate-forming protein